MSERVLVVEDNAALAENVAEMLRDEGAEVLLAYDTEDAEQQALEHGFDLAIVDIRLAGNASGLDLVPRLRRHSVHGEIVLMTGNATLDSAIQAIRRGVYAYIPKPFEPDHLVTLAKRALAQVALKRDKQALSQKLSASEALYRGVVETVEACILGLDAEGVIRFANRFAAERAECRASELSGRPFLSLCAQDHDARVVRESIGRALRGEPVRERECTLVSASGQRRRIRWTLTPLDTASLEAAQRAAGSGPHASGPVVLASGIDITERLLLEQRNAEAEAMAVMGTLTTGLAHEIRNPLNAAKLQLELLLRRAKRQQSAEVQTQLVEPAQLVRTELLRLSSLLDEFLDLARPRQLVRQPMPVAALFEMVTKLQEPVAADARVTLSSRVEPKDLELRADSDRLKQVLINLIANSIEALREREGGHVELVAEPDDGGGVCISVLDDGPGVPKEVAEAAFKPFVTSKQGGTGLGLAIVQKIATQHGGSARLLPRPEGGTIAQITIGP